MSLESKCRDLALCYIHDGCITKQGIIDFVQALVLADTHVETKGWAFKQYKIAGRRETYQKEVLKIVLPLHGLFVSHSAWGQDSSQPEQQQQDSSLPEEDLETVRLRLKRCEQLLKMEIAQ